MKCDHTRADSWWEHDGRGIPLARVCDKCYEEVMSKYRPEILQSYGDADVDEQIEEDQW